MDPRFIPINAIIALTTGDGGWPRILGDAGYRLHGIEAQISVAAKQKVVIDALLAHDGTLSVVLAECKSGQNLRESQMAVYVQVTPRHVARQVGLPFRADGTNVMVAGLLNHRERLLIAMEKLGLAVPLLLVGPREVRLEGDLPGIAGFSAVVPGPPPRVIVLDDQSSDEDFVRFLLPGLVAAAANHKTIIGIEELLRAVIPWWPLYHRMGGQKRLCDKATGALQVAIKEQFGKDFAVETRAGLDCGVVRVLKTPADNPPRGVTQGWQRLERQALRALGRSRPAPESPGQTSFSFEELGLEAEMPGEAG